MSKFTPQQIEDSLRIASEYAEEKLSEDYKRWHTNQYMNWKEDEKELDHITEYWDWIDMGLKMGFISEIEPDMIPE